MHKRPIRLALFSDSNEPSGVGCVMRMIAQHLPRSRYELFLVCSHDAGADGLAASLRPFVADTFRVNLRWDHTVADLPSLIRQLQTWQIDLFHNHVGATWEGDWGTIAARSAGVPVVVATDHVPCLIHHPHERERRSRINELLDRVWGVSDSVTNSLVEAGLVAPHRAATVENGIAEPKRGPTRTLARQQLELPNDAPVVLFLGRLIEQKDPCTLLRAMRVLQDRGTNAWAIIAGDGRSRQWCEADAARLGIETRTRFLGHYRDTPALFAAADALAMPSLFEGLPLAALEAMSVGLPVVGCEAPGVRDVVAHNVSGWLARQTDENDFADGLERALNPEIGPFWGQAGRACYKQRCTVKHFVERQEAAYQEVMEAVVGDQGHSAVRRRSEDDVLPADHRSLQRN